MLFGLLDEAEVDVPAGFRGLVDLTDFAVKFRYGEVELDAGIDRLALLEQVRRLLEHIESILRDAEERATENGHCDGEQ